MVDRDTLLQRLEDRYDELHAEATHILELKNALKFDAISAEKVAEQLDEVDR